VRDEVPHAGLRDEAERVDGAIGRGAGAVAVLQADAAVAAIAARSAVTISAGWVERYQRLWSSSSGRGALDGAALRRGQRAGEFRQRAGVRAEAEIGERPRRRREQRLQLVVGELGDRTPVVVGQHDAAAGAALHVDRHARRGEGLNVAVDRPRRNLERLSQLARGPAAFTLQQQRHEISR